MWRGETVMGGGNRRGELRGGGGELRGEEAELLGQEGGETRRGGGGKLT